MMQTSASARGLTAASWARARTAPSSAPPSRPRRRVPAIRRAASLQGIRCRGRPPPPCALPLGASVDMALSRERETVGTSLGGSHQGSSRSLPFALRGRTCRGLSASCRPSRLEQPARPPVPRRATTHLVRSQASETTGRRTRRPDSRTGFRDPRPATRRYRARSAPRSRRGSRPTAAPPSSCPRPIALDDATVAPRDGSRPRYSRKGRIAALSSFWRRRPPRTRQRVRLLVGRRDARQAQGSASSAPRAAPTAGRARRPKREMRRLVDATTVAEAGEFLGVRTVGTTASRKP
jgi:hypothetical protein